MQFQYWFGYYFLSNKKIKNDMKKIIYIFFLFIIVIGLLGFCINLEFELYDLINIIIFFINVDDVDVLVIVVVYGLFCVDGYSGLF